MTQVFYSPYEKAASGQVGKEKAHLKARKGALLRIQFSQERVGFSDLCPLPHFGDPEIEDLLFDNPVIGRDPLEAPLLQRSLECAVLDSKARLEKKSLYRKTPIRNHRLILSLLDFKPEDLEAARSQGFDTFKIKIGPQTKEETKALRELSSRLTDDEQIRLDFNHALEHHQAEDWIQENLSLLKKHCQWIEDPFPYHLDSWSKLYEDFRIPLALDFFDPRVTNDLAGINYLVIKPAVQNAWALSKRYQIEKEQIIFTHYMDSALGRLFAFYEAQNFYEGLASHERQRVPTCGLQSPHPTPGLPLEKSIENKGAYVFPPKGYGLGLKETLDHLDWRKLHHPRMTEKIEELFFT